MITTAMDASDYSYELMAIDDASTDGTLAILQAAQERFPHLRLMAFRRNGGSGTARRIGTREARGRIVVWTDADLTYPNSRIPEFVAYLDEHPDVDQVVGARTSEKGAHRVLRVPAKWVIRKVAERLTETKIPDLNSGLRAFRREVSLPYLHLLPPGFSCVTTIHLSFLSNQHSIDYLPIEYAKRSGSSKFHPLRDAYRYILQVLRMVMYFNPLKVLMPPALSIIGLGCVKLVLRPRRAPLPGDRFDPAGHRARGADRCGGPAGGPCRPVAVELILRSTTVDGTDRDGRRPGGRAAAVSRPRGIGRYVQGLASGLVETCPTGCSVTGWTARHRDDADARIPGVRGPLQAPTRPRVLGGLWERGLGPAPGRRTRPCALAAGSSAARSAARRHDPMTPPSGEHPQVLTARGVAFHSCMARRRLATRTRSSSPRGPWPTSWCRRSLGSAPDRSTSCRRCRPCRRPTATRRRGTCPAATARGAGPRCGRCSGSAWRCASSSRGWPRRSGTAPGRPAARAS